MSSLTYVDNDLPSVFIGLAEPFKVFAYTKLIMLFVFKYAGFLIFNSIFTDLKIIFG